MSDAIKDFENAINDRLIDKKDLSNHLSHFTLEDWRAVAKHRSDKRGLFGGVDELTVEETENEIIIKNDKDALRDESIVTGAKDIMLWTPALAGAGATLGWIASRYCTAPYLKLGGAALGVIAGIWKTKADQAALDELSVLRIPKDKLQESKTAMLDRSSSLGNMLLARSQRLSLG
jgi:hypothetical protein